MDSCGTTLWNLFAKKTLISFSDASEIPINLSLKIIVILMLYFNKSLGYISTKFERREFIEACIEIMKNGKQMINKGITGSKTSLSNAFTQIGCREIGQ